MRSRRATASAISPAIQRGLASVASNVPAGISRLGDTIAASTAGGTSEVDVDDDSTVIAGSPYFFRVDCANLDPVGERR